MCVSASEPHHLMIGEAIVMKIVPNIADSETISISAVNKMEFASSLRFSPKRLAMSADSETEIAINIANATNFGWVVRPTEATASAPRELTIIESTSPANAVKKDSTIAGIAIIRTVFVI